MSETVTEFLLARITEDEAQVDGFHQGSDPDFFWGPDRIRAECEAKRRIVELHRGLYESDPRGVCNNCGDLDVAHPCSTLRALAAVYADHADHRAEWAP